MMTIQRLMMKTDYMMEQIRLQASQHTIEEFKKAAYRYYQHQ